MASNEVEQHEMSAKQILSEFAQALHMVVKAGEFVLSDHNMTAVYADRLIPSIIQLNTEDYHGAVDAVKDALGTSTEKLEKLSTAILAFVS